MLYIYFLKFNVIFIFEFDKLNIDENKNRRVYFIIYRCLKVKEKGNIEVIIINLFEFFLWVFVFFFECFLEVVVF